MTERTGDSRDSRSLYRSRDTIDDGAGGSDGHAN